MRKKAHRGDGGMAAHAIWIDSILASTTLSPSSGRKFANATKV
ncbi:MAG TPA: hypothetical protein VE573_02565 [Nitrososphaeraceae archaeon]|nr:hypothetical protein [Nitrososphaeraceae archaeon]